MSKLITDYQSLIGAKTRYGYDIQTYDDGFGDLYISRNSIGINGIVRAQTWEDAYSICEEADETVDELQKEYGFIREHKRIVDENDGFLRWETHETPDVGAWMENELFQEAYGFRPNGANTRDKHQHGIYSKDLNGDYLDRLTPELQAELEITLEIKSEHDCGNGCEVCEDEDKEVSNG